MLGIIVLDCLSDMSDIVVIDCLSDNYMLDIVVVDCLICWTIDNKYVTGIRLETSKPKCIGWRHAGRYNACFILFEHIYSVVLVLLS